MALVAIGAAACSQQGGEPTPQPRAESREPKAESTMQGHFSAVPDEESLGALALMALWKSSKENSKSGPEMIEPVLPATSGGAAASAPAPLLAGVERWRPLVESHFGERAGEAMIVMGCEDPTGDPAAIGDHGASYGLMQINIGWQGTYGPQGWLSWYNATRGASLVPADLLDGETNLRMAKAILDYRGGRWSGSGGWTCADQQGIS